MTTFFKLLVILAIKFYARTDIFFLEFFEEVILLKNLKSWNKIGDRVRIYVSLKFVRTTQLWSFLRNQNFPRVMVNFGYSYFVVFLWFLVTVLVGSSQMYRIKKENFAGRQLSRSGRRSSVKTGVLDNFVKFKGKYQSWSLLF